MAPPIWSLQRWARQRVEPLLYDQLPMEEHDLDRETKGDSAAVETGLHSGSSSTPSSPPHGHGHHQRHHSYGFPGDPQHERFDGRGLQHADAVLSSSTSSASSVSFPSTSAPRRLRLLLRVLGAIWLVATEPLRRVAYGLTSLRGSQSGTNAGDSDSSKHGSLWTVFLCLLPSFLQPSTKAKRMHPTAWLDGLRGVAAFLVVWHHASLLWFSWRIHSGYGSAPGENLFIQLPIVRLVVSGPPQVAIFFVISGYALSYKPLRLSRMGRHGEAGETIHSSVFRRYTRLFIMPVVVSFVVALMTHFDCYGLAPDFPAGVAIPTRRPPRPDTLVEQVADWLHYVRRLIDPISKDINRGRPFSYDPNLWTLPVEFDSSLFIFLCHAAFNRLRPRLRLLLTFGLLCYAQAFCYWETFLFIGGMFLCDLHFHIYGTGIGGRAVVAPAVPMHAAGNAEVLQMASQNSSSSSPQPSSLPFHVPPASTGSASLPWSPAPAARAGSDPSPWWKRTGAVASVVSFVLALYVLSVPEEGKGGPTSPGFQTLLSMVPQHFRDRHLVDDFWVPVAAVWLVCTVDHTPFLQRLFTAAFPQYLGTISYSMYLVHGPLIWTAGHWLARKAFTVTGTETESQYGLGIALSAVALWALIIYCADVVTRTIDVRAVNFGRWLYEKWEVKPEQ